MAVERKSPSGKSVNDHIKSQDHTLTPFVGIRHLTAGSMERRRAKDSKA